MHLRPALTLAALTLALAACQRNAPEPAPATTPTPDATVSTPPPPPAPPPAMRLRGKAIMGKDGYGLEACGNPTQQIATFDDAAGTYIDEFLKNGAHEFFVDGWGMADADGKLHFTAIERALVEGNCDERDLGDFLYRARGNEPFWSIDVAPAGIVLQRPDQAELRAEYQPMEKTPDGGRKLANDQFTLVLTPGMCHDGMSEATYGWSATATVGAETLKGCAYAGLVSE